MIMEYSEDRSARTREPRMPDDEFLCIKGYMVPRERSAQSLEQGFDLSGLDRSAMRD
ncbi:MAG: hypothetical protein JJT93_03025 [Gammaproteobacteria bacterium]|nr:hypothetical protein [Gammaproteobacteria bacterium]